MTISSTTRKVGPFIGDGVAFVFPFPFKVFTPEDVRVARLDVAAGIETSLVMDADYTVSLNPSQDAEPGGSISLAAPLAVGFNLVITSRQAALQGTDITNQGGFYPEVVEDGFDTLTIADQQIIETCLRSIRYPLTDPSLSAILPPAAQRADKFLYFGDDGAPDLVSREPLRVRFFAGLLTPAADGVNRIFTITDAGTPLGSAPLQVIVWRNFPLVVGIGYTLNVDQVTFTDAPNPGDALYAQGSAYL